MSWADSFGISFHSLACSDALVGLVSSLFQPDRCNFAKERGKKRALCMSICFNLSALLLKLGLYLLYEGLTSVHQNQNPQILFILSLFSSGRTPELFDLCRRHGNGEIVPAKTDYIWLFLSFFF